MEHCRSPDGVSSISVRPYYTMLSRVYLALAMGFLVCFPFPLHLAVYLKAQISTKNIHHSAPFLLVAFLKFFERGPATLHTLPHWEGEHPLPHRAPTFDRLS